MPDPITAFAVSTLASEVASYATSKVTTAARNKYSELTFLDEKIEEAAQETAKQYPELDPKTLPALFDSEEITDRINHFQDGGEFLDLNDILASVDSNMLDPELDISEEELATQFLNILQQKIAEDDDLAFKLLIAYNQRIFDYALQLGETQEEILFSLEKVASRDLNEQLYTAFTPIEKRFGRGTIGGRKHTSSFYNREKEFDKITDFVNSRYDALIIGGPSGIGKTRLAFEAALRIQSSDSSWTVYSVNPLADIERGLSEIDFDKEENLLFLLDDARDSEKIELLCRIVEEKENEIKLLFTEQPWFVETRQREATRSGLATEQVKLGPLGANDIQDLLQNEYGIQNSNTWRWVTSNSEGNVLLIHQLAKWVLSDELDDLGPTSQQDVFGLAFDQNFDDLERYASHTSLDRSTLEQYIGYLATIGHLNTNNDNLMEEFVGVLSLDESEERQYRRIVRSAGIVEDNNGRLQIQPLALRTHIAYKIFFDESSFNFKENIYDSFSDHSEKSLVDTLIRIAGRYDCREAEQILDKIVGKYIESVEKTPITERARILSYFENLGYNQPDLALELVTTFMEEELPNDADEEDEIWIPGLLEDPTPAGNFLLRCITILWHTLLQRPEDTTSLLIAIARDYPGSAVRNKVFQYIRQEIEPSTEKHPEAQLKLLSVLEDYLRSGLDVELRIELVEVIGNLSREQIEDHFQDPAERHRFWFQRGPLPLSEQRKQIRVEGVKILFELIWKSDSRQLRKNTAEKITHFCTSQVRYKGKIGELINRDELALIYRSATTYAWFSRDLDCLQQLNSLTTRNIEGLEIEASAVALQDAYSNNELYQQMRRMNPPIRGLEEQEDQITGYIETIDSPWDAEIERFKEVLDHSSSTYNHFFRLLGKLKPEMGEQILEETPDALKPCRVSIITGMSISSPEKAKRIAEEAVDQNIVSEACAAIRQLLVSDRAFAIGTYEGLLEDTAPYTEDEAIQLARCVHGEWEDNQNWTESKLVEVLAASDEVTPKLLKSVLRVLPVHDDEELQTVSESLLIEILSAAETLQSLNEPYGLRMIISENAERNPKAFVDFCRKRVEYCERRIGLFPHDFSLNKSRMRNGTQYSKAVETVVRLIVDPDEWSIYGGLFAVFPTAEIVKRFIDNIENYSEDEIIRILHYCDSAPLNEDIDRLLRACMDRGIDNIRRNDRAQSAVYDVIINSTGGRIVPATEEPYSRQFELIQGWKDDESLSPAVRQFARNLEDYLYDMVEEDIGPV
ncbi:RNA helicase domain-containing protein [Halalkalicoccus subterraneus]|uniref:RNA helicase domain-containing protein n=1 Tax=Halalkalicoccus subterraneus TaxID=2675002 RepID=UPI001FE7A9CD|nr:RNA helicase domain-containing protein [Halalkalicoccus subterraneus]